MAIGDIIPLDGGGAVAIGGLNAIANMQANDMGALTQMASIDAQTQQANQQAALQQRQMQQDAMIANRDHQLATQQVANQRGRALGDQVLQAKQMEMQQAQVSEAKQRQQQMQQAFMNGDMEGYKGLLAVHNPQALASMQKAEQDIQASILGQQKDLAELEGKQLDNFKTKVGIAAPAAMQVIKNPNLYPAMKDVFKAIDPNAPDEFNPDYVMGLAALGGKKDTAFDKAMAKQNAQTYTDLSNKMQDYDKAIAGYNELNSIADKVTTGPDPLDFRKGFKAFFGTDAAKYDALVSNIINPLALAMRSGNMPGSMSDKDVEFLKESIANPKFGKEGFKASIKYGLAIANASKSYGQAKMKWLEDHSGDLSGFDQAWQASDQSKLLEKTLQGLRGMNTDLKDKGPGAHVVRQDYFADTFDQ